MDEFLKKIADILEADEVRESDELESFATWDSLSILSIIAMLDANYGVNIHAAEFERVKTPGELWNVVQSKKQAS